MNDVIYMNNAATSWPKPPCVAEAVSRAIIARPGAMHRGGTEDFDVFDAVRERLARLIGAAEPSGVALGANATWGLNLGIFGFPFTPGDTVVTTCAEHNSVLRPLYALEQRGVIKTVYLPVDTSGRAGPEVWRDAMAKYRPRLAVFTHASNVTGAVHDAEAMTREAKAVGASVLIDASQTLGWRRLEAEKWGADMVAFTGHKYLLGPQGTGGLWVRPGLSLTPRLVGGTGIKSDMDTMPEEMPLHLEAGTGNEPSFHGLLAALDWAEANPRCESACSARLEALTRGLREAGADVIEPTGERTPVVSFTAKGVSVPEIGFMLSEGSGIVCRTGLHCAPKIFPYLDRGQTVRLSLSRFTTDAEIGAAVESVREILS